jgi:hypothetical protein
LRRYTEAGRGNRGRSRRSERAAELRCVQERRITMAADVRIVGEERGVEARGPPSHGTRHAPQARAGGELSIGRIESGW